MLTILAAVTSGAFGGGGDAGAAGAASTAAGNVAAAVGNVAGATAGAVAGNVAGTVATAGAASVEAVSSIGGVFLKIGAFVALLAALCFLLVPNWLKRLKMSGGSELRTIGITGLMFFLAFAAQMAGFSTALGAFIFGAIIGGLRQKKFIEEPFDGLRSVFGSIFFVAIGLLADPAKLLNATALGLTALLVVLTIFGRWFATSLALILTGSPPSDAKRSGLLLTPLGEFTFIIAGIAVAKGIFPEYLNPVAIIVSVLTVIITPFICRKADAILAFEKRIEPPFITKALDGYHDFILRLGAGTSQRTAGGKGLWQSNRKEFLGIAREMLFVTGLSLFSGQLLNVCTGFVKQILNSTNTVYFGRDFSPLINFLYCQPFAGLGWAVAWPKLIFIVIVVCLGIFFLFNIGYRIWKLTGNLAENWTGPGLHQSFLKTVFILLISAPLLIWMFLILPPELGKFAGGYIPICVLLLAGVVVILRLLYKRLIAWHESWEQRIKNVISGKIDSNTVEEDIVHSAVRQKMCEELTTWDMCLQTCVIPENATVIGQSLKELAIPSRFDVSISDIERANTRIPVLVPETRLYPNDKLWLFGKKENLEKTREFLEERTAGDDAAELEEPTLERCVVENSPRAGHSLAELRPTAATGARIAGIQHNGNRITNPGAGATIENGDGLLVVGTKQQIAAFKIWLAGDAATK
jgi:CPA2 family monovalent cation:H+ antiporter-2